MAANILFRGRTQRPETPQNDLDSSTEASVIEDTPDQVSKTKKASSTDADSSVDLSSINQSYRSQVLESDESGHDLTDDESDDDIPLVTRGKLAVISDSEESGDEEDGSGRFQTFHIEKDSFNSGRSSLRSDCFLSASASHQQSLHSQFYYRTHSPGPDFLISKFLKVVN